MNERSVFSIGGAVLVIVAGCVWWIMSATPSSSAIEAARQPEVKVPQLNLGTLDASTGQDRTINGTLPIPVDAGSLGREDPFAGV